MNRPDRVEVSATSLPDMQRGHGIFLTFYDAKGYKDSVFLDRSQAVVLRDDVDRALEEGADRAAV